MSHFYRETDNPNKWGGSDRVCQDFHGGQLRLRDQRARGSFERLHIQDQISPNQYSC